METHRRWISTAAEILSERSAGVARSRLAAALLEASGAAQAARVHVDGDGRASWFVTGDGAPDTVEHLPVGSAVNQHPLHRFHTESGRHDPALLPEVVRSGWAPSRRTMEIIEELRLTMHQLSVPVETTSGPGYDGWVLVSPEAVGEGVVEQLASVQSLILGLDRHIRLLGQLTAPSSPAGSLLTPRETVVLTLLAAGRTVDGIAARLGISPRTVHKHQEHLYRKLGAVDRLSAVLRGQELGLLSRQQPGPSWPPQAVGVHSPQSSRSATHLSR